MNHNIKAFFKFRDQSFTEIVELTRKHEITHFEKNAFTSFVVSAAHTAETYFSLDNLPFNKIKHIEDFNIAMQAYALLCLVELYEFFTIAQNKKEIQNKMDVSKEELIEDFGKVLGGENIDNHIKNMLTAFDGILNETKDRRDLWYNQAIYFGKLLSNNDMEFEKLIEENIATELDLSMTTQHVRVENAKTLQKIIFGKET